MHSQLKECVLEAVYYILDMSFLTDMPNGKASMIFGLHIQIWEIKAIVTGNGTV